MQLSVPGNDIHKMANEVTFSGSSAETIELAKSFWKSIEPPPAPKSTLFVSGLNHRLPTALAIHSGL